MKTFNNLLVLSIVLLVSAGVFAQDQTGSIYGMVTTEDGAAIVGVKVTVTSSALIRPLSALTNDRGSYIFPALPVGTYTLTFEAENYSTTRVDDFTVILGQGLRYNTSLKTGVVGEQVVTITGEAPIIDVKSNQTGMLINKELFQSLPKGRNFESLVNLAPGAQQEDTIGGGVQIDGSSASENVWIVDGVDTTSFFTGNNNNRAAFEFVEEVQVRTGGYEAQYGGSLGGVINVVTRSGGNEFHGEGSFFYNDDAFDAESNRQLRINPFNDKDPEVVRFADDDYNRIEVGGGIGGYILKDRIWFFGSFLPVFQDTNRTVNFLEGDGTPYLTDTFTSTNTTYQAAAKVSAQISDRIRFSSSFSTDWTKHEGELPDRDGLGNPYDNWSEKGDIDPGYLVAGNLDFTLTDSLYFNFKGGYSQVDHEQLGALDQVWHRHFGSIDVFDTSGIPSQYVVPFGYSTGSNVATQKNLQEKYNFSGDMTYFTNAGGQHQFKTGFHFFRIGHDINAGTTQDYIIFYWDQAYNSIVGTPGLNGVRGKYGYYRDLTSNPLGRGTVADISADRYAFFVQDGWGVTDKLTINAGVRFESEDVPSYSDLAEFADSPLEWGFDEKIAPRAGFAYDVRGDGTWKIYGNYGRYYDVMKLALAEGSYGGFKWVDGFYSLDTLEWWTIGDATAGTANQAGALYETVDRRRPSFDTTDPQIDPTSVDEYIFGTEYQLTDQIGMSVRFTHKRLNEIIEDVGIVAPGAEVFVTGNPGKGFAAEQRAAAGGLPSNRPLRHYWGLDLRFLKRFADNWQGGANLTFSRLTGNIGGLASSDEFGRQDPNVERFFDNWFPEFTGAWEPLDGVLPTDRKYTIKLFGSYVFQGMLEGLVLGVNQNIADGTPLSTDLNVNSFQGYLINGRGDLGRTPPITQTDLRLEYNFDLSESYRAQVAFDIINMFDQRTAIRFDNTPTRDSLSISDEELIQYYNSRTPVNSQFFFDRNPTARYDPRFGQPNGWQAPRTMRLGVKFIF